MAKTELSVGEVKKEALRLAEEAKRLLPFVQIDSVIRALNNPRAVSDTVQRLADMLTSLQALREKEDRGELIHPDELEPINDYLVDQKWISKLTVYGRNLLVFVNESSTDGARRSRAEQWIASAIAELAATGKLERIHRCPECGTWFYARLDAVFHDKTCRQRVHERTDKAKQRHKRNDALSSVASARKQFKARKRRIA